MNWFEEYSNNSEAAGGAAGVDLSEEFFDSDDELIMKEPDKEARLATYYTELLKHIKNNEYEKIIKICKKRKFSKT